MKDTDYAVTAKDELLRAIGRNIVNFQKLEKCLKVLTRFSDLVATMSTASTRIARNIARAESLTLGGAIREWQLVAGGSQNGGPTTSDLFEPSISLSYGPFVEPQALEQHAQSLSELARERNELVHHALADFDYSSEEACIIYSLRLESQNARILAELSFLAPIMLELKSLHEWMREPSTIEELAQAIVGAQSAHDA